MSTPPSRHRSFEQPPSSLPHHHHHWTTSLTETGPLLVAQVKYSEFVNGLQRENISVNRKMLSELAANEPYSFKALVDQVRFMKAQQQQAQQ